ncbi:MAG: ABC transporter ATP-binding protein [Myxococcota bacterium]
MSTPLTADLGSEPGATLRLLLRALHFVSPYWGRIAVKGLLTILSIVPRLLLPWPIKIVIDHVIRAKPVGDPSVPYPAFLQTVLEPLRGMSPGEILAWMIAIQGLLIIAIGAMGSTAAEVDRTEDNLASGRDMATRSENEANYGHSFAAGLFGLFDFRFTLRLTQAFNHHFRSKLFERIQSLPMRALDDGRIGDSVYRVMYDTPSITSVVYRLFLTPTVGVVGLLLTAAAIGVVYEQAPGIAGAAFAFLPLSLAVSLAFGALLQRRAQRAREAGARTTSSLEEGFANILAVQSLGAESRQREHFARDSWTSFDEFRHYLLATFAAVATGGIPGLLIAAWVFVEVTDLVIAGQLSTGDFAVLFIYFVQISGYSVRIGALWLTVQNAVAGIARVFSIMDLPAEVDPPGAKALAPMRREIRVENVHFRYGEESEDPALRGVSFEIPRGQITALVGPAGAGKTTLAYMIPRFLDPDAGRVLVDGIDVAGGTLASLREQIAFVFQETALFDASVEENIRMGKRDATDAEVRRAARAAGADDFIQDLPDGYRTGLGRSGGMLSVGQKQRIAIARALVREAPILILDEPTSALDTETEGRLIETLVEASRSRAVLVIAHRLSSVRVADQILFMDDGRILESGSPSELMARPGSAYRRFVELQTGEDPTP